MSTNCPSCDRPAAGRAFGTTDAYVRCSLGHVFAAAAEVHVAGCPLAGGARDSRATCIGCMSAESGF